MRYSVAPRVGRGAGFFCTAFANWAIVRAMSGKKTRALRLKRREEHRGDAQGEVRDPPGSVFSCIDRIINWCHARGEQSRGGASPTIFLTYGHAVLYGVWLTYLIEDLGDDWNSELYLLMREQPNSLNNADEIVAWLGALDTNASDMFESASHRQELFRRSVRMLEDYVTMLELMQPKVH